MLLKSPLRARLVQLRSVIVDSLLMLALTTAVWGAVYLLTSAMRDCGFTTQPHLRARKLLRHLLISRTRAKFAPSTTETTPLRTARSRVAVGLRFSGRLARGVDR
jgi:hypothetical protein